MKQMQDEQLSKCYKKDGWPRPFVHFGGAVELAQTPEHFDRLYIQEVKMLISVAIICFIGFIGFILILR